MDVVDGAEPSSHQGQTRDAFAYKWKRRASYDSPAMAAFTREWLLEKYCDGDERRLQYWLGPKGSVVLDVGCGAGLSAIALFGDHLRHHRYIGVDILDAVDVARERFTERGYPG